MLMAAALLAPAAMGAAFTFETLPANGQIAALPGGTAGWGYRIVNPTENWLMLTNLSSDAFLDGTAVTLFDFPILAAGEERIVQWESGIAGLFEFTWDTWAAMGSSNSGQFVVEGEFWDGDPLSGGNFVDWADPQSASYSVGVAAIPEPGALWLVSGALAGLCALTRRRR